MLRLALHPVTRHAASAVAALVITGAGMAGIAGIHGLEGRPPSVRMAPPAQAHPAPVAVRPSPAPGTSPAPPRVPSASPGPVLAQHLSPASPSPAAGVSPQPSHGTPGVTRGGATPARTEPGTPPGPVPLSPRPLSPRPPSLIRAPRCGVSVTIASVCARLGVALGR